MGTPAQRWNIRTHPLPGLIAAACMLVGTVAVPPSAQGDDTQNLPHRAIASQTSWTGFAVLAALFRGMAGTAHPEDSRHQSVTRTTADYAIPDVTLVDSRGKDVPLRANLDDEGPVMLNFIYTSCTTVCPAMTTTFSQLQSLLPAKMVSISIDPEHDTPEQMRKYARKFNAGPQWEMLTGSVENSIAVQRAFDAYRGSDKTNCKPVTFLRTGKGKPWVRLEGQASASDILKEYRQLTAVK